MGPGQVPGRQIGSTTAADVNALARWMSGIVEREGLPQKLLVVHRFTKSMIRNEQRLKRYPGVAITVNVDGFGTRAQKVAKYREVHARLQAPPERLQALPQGGHGVDEAPRRCSG
jgi:hypothetical protein